MSLQDTATSDNGAQRGGANDAVIAERRAPQPPRFGTVKADTFFRAFERHQRYLCVPRAEWVQDLDMYMPYDENPNEPVVARTWTSRP